ncbi:precorrin-6y C5,15-methyltransferase (decarboxylating) subunit CbiE [Zavarzinia compransoris]|uniref:precorrin-6y C5,15-methyltransferase (decarboxylating) subunit CbiE n=1 Tax=Zavarzinia marina TaxID=2911065 RepID=UPI001F3CF70A|nr:precorrin-6y C5,15-methyltransferase (decarboxylating) subunit CbiE [Zavarzinia marina]MCF4167389.1 precorrin-6y C5,15-methyltransferase (decarboxylating) subunit CbiE [Zavarzinia marina]
MAEPWLSIIGIGEDGLAGLGVSSRNALAAAEFVFGGPRHLALAGVGARGRPWPVPFDIGPVIACRGRRTAVLASGDPFWHGAGAVLARALEAGEWVAYPAPSTFALAAARLGWALECTACLGLHAAPFEGMLTHLRAGARLLCLLRDGAAPARLAAWLCDRGFGDSRLHVLEALGGPRERIRATRARDFALDDVATPVAIAIEAAGPPGLPRAPGLPDDRFVHDGQITKAPVRALTLSALAPRGGEMLWDLGAGSGSIAVEWCLAAGGRAVAVERRADRLAGLDANLAAFGLRDRVTVIGGEWADALPDLPAADAVFVGGGATAATLAALWARLRPGARLVINAVTLETEHLLAEAAARLGGTLLRFELAEAKPLGSFRGWVPARPIVQWSVTKCA